MYQQQPYSWAILTWSHQLNLLRHCGAKLIGSVAPVFALRSNQVLVWNQNSSIFVFVAPFCDIWLLDFFPIFCPPVSNGGENNVCHESLPQRWTLFAPMPLVLTLVAGFLLLHTQLLHFGGKEVRWLDLMCDSQSLEAAPLQCEIIQETQRIVLKKLNESRLYKTVELKKHNFVPLCCLTFSSTFLNGAKQSGKTVCQPHTAQSGQIRCLSQA